MRQSFKKREFKKNSGQKVVEMAYEGRSFSGLSVKRFQTVVLCLGKFWCFEYVVAYDML